MLESKFVKFLISVLKWKFLISVLKWQVNSSSNFALFFNVMTHNSSGNFKVTLFYFGQKDPIKVPILTLFSYFLKDPIKVPILTHQSPNFDNLPNFSCYFSNHRSVFLQNLHNSSEWWKITPLYFCSSNIIYFDQREPIKTQIF